MGSEKPVTLGEVEWRLVLDYIDRPKDLASICEVSKGFNALATLHLYTNINFTPVRPSYYQLPFARKRQKRGEENDAIHQLLLRLSSPDNGDLRKLVREIEVGGYPYEAKPELHEGVTKLIPKLPNVQHIRVLYSLKLSTTFIQSVNNHPNKPKMHLLSMNGDENIPVDVPLTSVTTLMGYVNPFTEKTELLGANQWREPLPNRAMVDFQELFFACPNLEKYHISKIRPYGGCVMPPPPVHRQIRSFQLTGDEIFPPLKHLEFDGYVPEAEEWPHWEKGMDWTKLEYLGLGPLGGLEVLSQMISVNKPSLKELYIKAYDDMERGYVRFHAREPDTRPLAVDIIEGFLESFDSLERLTIQNYTFPRRIAVLHPRLKHLHLHNDDPTYDDAERPVFSQKEIFELDANHPHLESLEIDIHRNGVWPKATLKALAKGFPSLRDLTLHFEIGLIPTKVRTRSSTANDPILRPILDADSAKKLGKDFFSWRGQSCLRTLTVKNGGVLRRWPQWEPRYVQVEREHGCKFELKAPIEPGDTPTLVDLNVRECGYDMYNDPDL